jgi:hypothetical protein
MLPDLKINNLPGTTADCELNRPAANGAVFDQRLITLRGIDLNRELFTAVRTNDLGFGDQFHAASRLCLDLQRFDEQT